jgi:hypothetical protein
MESVPVTCCGCDSRVQWSDLAQHWEVKRAEAGFAVVPRCKRVVPRCKRVALRCIVSRRVASCRAALQRVGPRCNVSCRVANVSCRVANVSCCQAFCTLGPASEAASLIAADVAALKAAAAKVGEHTRNGGQLRLRTASNRAASVQPRSHATDRQHAYDSATRTVLRATLAAQVLDDKRKSKEEKINRRAAHAAAKAAAAAGGTAVPAGGTPSSSSRKLQPVTLADLEEVNGRAAVGCRWISCRCGIPWRMGCSGAWARGCTWEV